MAKATKKTKTPAKPAPAATVESDASAAPGVAHGAKTPRYTSDGVLLNPEDFNVGSDGVLSPRG